MGDNEVTSSRSETLFLSVCAGPTVVSLFLYVCSLLECGEDGSLRLALKPFEAIPTRKTSVEMNVAKQTDCIIAVLFTAVAKIIRVGDLDAYI